MQLSPASLALLTLGASLSPLLTSAALWQLKEWRVDRLREHLRAEGMLRQLFGIVRPVLVLGGILATWVYPALFVPAMGTLVVLNAVQIVLRRQPYPVWTMKARILVLFSLLLTCGGVFLFEGNTTSLLALPLLQPFFLCAAWIAFHPIDTTCKNRILNKAKELRAAHPEWTVIGITGSVGKTTTKELLSHVLKHQNVLCTPAYVNTEIGVAQWLLREAPKHPEANILVVEMGAYGRGEIALLCQVMQPTMGIVTFIGRQHLGVFGSQEELQKAKGELVEALPENGHAFLNADSQLCAELAKIAKCPATTVGTGGHADLEGFDIEETPEGIRLRAGEKNWNVPLHGTHNATNVLLAIAAAREVGVPDTEIDAQLQSFVPPMHTFSVRKQGSVILLDDTHNCSPASFKAGVEWARGQPYEHKILLTSGIIELGDEATRIHTELGALCAGNFDRVIFTQKRMAQAFAKGFGKPVELFGKETPGVPEEALVLCLGRMPERTIQHILPHVLP